MTEATFQELQKQIDNLRLPVNKADLIQGLQRRLNIVRPILTVQNTNLDLPQPISIKEKDPSDDSEFFQTTILAKLKFLEGTLTELRQLNSIKGSPSFNFEKVADLRVRSQLIADNIRMEHALLDLTVYTDFQEEMAFRRFCAFAFFQVEEMLNFYYHQKFADNISSLLADFKNKGVNFYGKVPKNLTEVSTAQKIFAYTNDKNISTTYHTRNELHSLRLVRNKEEHRCTVKLKSWEFSILEKKFFALGLKEKREAAKAQAVPSTYTPSEEEKEIENEYNAINYIRSRNHISVRKELEKMYINITK